LPWWVWIPLGVFALSALGTTVGLVVAAVKTFRALGVAGRATTGALDELTEAAAELEARLTALSERTEEAEGQLTRLQVSLEKLSVLRWALGDAQGTVARLRDAVPRK
jgi:hypothetical protein